MTKKVIKWLRNLLVVYLLLGLTLYFLQTFFLFHPKRLPADYTFHFDTPFEEVKIPFEAKDTISMVKFFPAVAVRKGVVIYFHGNKQNIERYAKFAGNFTSHGYEVWMEDYPGFGKSKGERNEGKLYRQALLIYQLAHAKYAGENIILYGKSFGTGIAAYTASQRNCRSVILETPYYSIPDLFSSYAPIYPAALMAKYTIPANEYLKLVKAPVTIFHGTSDEVIPYYCAAKLKGVLKPTDVFITIPKGTHHNLNEFELFHQKLDSILSN